MADSKSNLATEGLSGQADNFVFRRRKADGKVFVSVHPFDHEKDPTGKQELLVRKTETKTN